MSILGDYLGVAIMAFFMISFAATFIFRANIRSMLFLVTFPLAFLVGKKMRPYIKFFRIPTSKFSDYILSKADGIVFDSRKTVESYWPVDKFPELYTELRPGLKRAFFDDGKLVGRYDVGILINNLYTRELYANSVKSGLDAALAIAFGSFLVMVFVTVYLSVVSQIGDGATFPQHSMQSALAILSDRQDLLDDSQALEIERWGDYVLREEKGLFDRAREILEVAGGLTINLVKLVIWLIGLTVATILVFSFSASVLIPAIVSDSINKVSEKWRTPTKDALAREKLRRDEVSLSRDVFRKALKTDEYIVQTKGKDLITLGTATGLFASRGAIGNPLKSDPVVLDMESLFQHTLVFGGTGEGKTTAIIKPFFKQVIGITNANGNKFGALCMDAKGVLWRDLKIAAEKAGRGDDVVLIGANPEMAGIDPLAMLRPADLASACRSVMSSTGDGDKEGFFKDTAATVINHSASVIYAVSRFRNNTGNTPYSLTSIYRLIINESILESTLNIFDDVEIEPGLFVDGFDQIGELEAALIYLRGSWGSLAAATKSGVIANVEIIFDPICSNTNLSKKFSVENPKAESLERIFDGKLYLLSISSVEHNISARLLQVLIKTAFYRAARIREIHIGSAACQNKPVIVVIDEAQEIVTADSSGLSDGSYWNVARSGGISGLIGTQTMAALYQALGKEPTNNLVQQFRSKIFLRTEDLETHKYCIELAGQERRALSFQLETFESLEARYNCDDLDLVDYSVARIAADHAKDLVDKAGLAEILRVFNVGDKPNMSAKLASNLFMPDTRFINDPHHSGGGQGHAGTTDYNPVTNSKKEAAWRAEDKQREWLAEGMDYAPLLTSSDIINGGRWYAYAHIQRAGMPVQDVIEIHHDFD